MGDLNELIKKTQDTLQPLITKPKLAEKLLQKPPFRFLHDLFSALIVSTGFAKGLYTDYELDSANMKEKHQKLQYLDKIIFCTGQCHGKEIDVRAAKIVAGLEPENTNIFLVELALAASNSSLDWGGAVQKTLSAYPPLPETLAATGGSEAKGNAPAAEAPKEAQKDESKEAEEKAKADERAAREKAKRAKEERERAEADKQKAAEEAQPSEPKPSSSESKSRPSSNSKQSRESASAATNEWTAQVSECNGDVERTKDMIEKLISKPKMSAKLLSKPPFRFLHDIVSELTRATGFADGLYNAEELDSNNIKEKQPKIDYLQKIIHCVGCQLNIEIEAKPAKIVAGLEPDDTNKFLQMLTIAAKAGNSSTSVQRVLAGDTRPTVNSAEAKTKRQSSTVRQEDVAPTPAQEAKAEAKQAKVEAPGPMKAIAISGDDDGDLKSDSKITAEDDSKPGTANRTSRPTTARRRPPKLKENVKEVGRLVRDDKVTPTVGIMKDGDNPDSDDDTQEVEKGNNNRDILQEDGATHGKLIRDILKDQSSAEEERKAKDEEETKGGDGGEGGIRLGKRRKSFKEKSKSGTSTAAEINELRTSIQKICQATNPVGKCIEYVYEDMEAMARELEVWKMEYEKKCTVYEEEKKKTEEALQPLTLQLVEVEEQIKEQVHKINTIKATIAKNEEKTLKLLRMVVTS